MFLVFFILNKINVLFIKIHIVKSSVDDIKKRLLKNVGEVESIDFLKVIEEIVFHISRENDDFELSDSEILELEKRREDFLSGKDKGITFEELKAKIFKGRGV